MEEKLYTIPVKEAYETKCECAICKMKSDIEKDAISFTMGPSYMEDYIRFETDEQGFCNRHIQKMYNFNNRLGLSFILETHLKKVNHDIEKISKNKNHSGGIFKKKDKNPICVYLDKLNSSCFVCNRIEKTLDRYIATIFYLIKNDDKEFDQLYRNSFGACNEHMVTLLEGAERYLNGDKKEEFVSLTTKLYLENMSRIIDDVEWFQKKFDYRYKDEPWKNSKDALIRALIKTNSVMDLED